MSTKSQNDEDFYSSSEDLTAKRDVLLDDSGKSSPPGKRVSFEKDPEDEEKVYTTEHEHELGAYLKNRPKQSTLKIYQELAENFAEQLGIKWEDFGELCKNGAKELLKRVGESSNLSREGAKQLIRGHEEEFTTKAGGMSPLRFFRIEEQLKIDDELTYEHRATVKNEFWERTGIAHGYYEEELAAQEYEALEILDGIGKRGVVLGSDMGRDISKLFANTAILHEKPLVQEAEFEGNKVIKLTKAGRMHLDAHLLSLWSDELAQNRAILLNDEAISSGNSVYVEKVRRSGDRIRGAEEVNQLWNSSAKDRDRALGDLADEKQSFTWTRYAEMREESREFARAVKEQTARKLGDKKHESGKPGILKRKDTKRDM